MPDSQETKFNSSLKTSDCIREWCIEVGQYLSASPTYKQAHHLLWMLNNEIYGWYAKLNSVKVKFAELQDYENKADNVAANINSEHDNFIYSRLLKKWSRRVIEECYRIGWLAKENDNIYDQDEL